MSRIYLEALPNLSAQLEELPAGISAARKDTNDIPSLELFDFPRIQLVPFEIDGFEAKYTFQEISWNLRRLSQQCEQSCQL